MRPWLLRLFAPASLILLLTAPAFAQTIVDDPQPSAPCPGQNLKCIQGSPHPNRARNGVQRVYAVYYYDSGPMAGQYAAGCGTAWQLNQSTNGFNTFITARHVLEGNDAGGHYSAVSVQLEFFYVPRPGRVCGVLANNECHDFATDCETPQVRQAPCWDWDQSCDLARILLQPFNVPAGADWFGLFGADPAVGTQVWIPQHPQGRCMEWDEGNVVAAPGGCEFQHQVSTQGGSSGAPVLSGAGPWVVGVHVAASVQGGLAVCPNSAVYQSRLQAFLAKPFVAGCDPTRTAPKSWGTLKTLYR
jgi:hypothetical protein